LEDIRKPRYLAPARLRWKAKATLMRGRDPRDTFAAQAGSMTVRALIESYLAKHVRPNLRSAAAVERRFTKNLTPIIGNLALADLHKRQINSVVDPILGRSKPVEAARCFEDMRAMFRWAVARGDLDHSPMEGMRKPGGAKARERVLGDDEINQLWSGLVEALPRSRACQRIIKLCLLTAQRVGEISGMSRAELDLKARLWMIPGSRTKNKHKHTVPLSEAAVAVIKDAMADAGDGDFLFPDAEGQGALPAHAVAKTITKAQDRLGLDHWTAHDLRRTAVSNMAALGVPPIVLGHVINHRSVTKAGVTLAVYAQYDYGKEKRQGLELWAERLAGIVGATTTVVFLHGARS
jgi:integrase